MSMDTDQLIKTLAADNAHRPRPVSVVLALALLAAAPVSILMFVAELGVRPDVMTAMHNPFFDLKFAVTLALASAAVTISLHLSRPEASLRGFVWLLAIPAGLLVAGISGEMMMPQRLPMMTRLVGHNSKVCMTAVPLMSLPLLAASLFGLRHGGVVVGGIGRDALRLALHRRLAPLRRDLVFDRNRAHRRAGCADRIEGAEVLKLRRADWRSVTRHGRARRSMLADYAAANPPYGCGSTPVLLAVPIASPTAPRRGQRRRVAQR